MDRPLIDLDAFRDLQDTAGADFVGELVETFAEEAPELIAELRSALAEGVAERFRRAAHSLKSNGHTFGALRLAEQARALELGGFPSEVAAVDVIAGELELAISSLRELARG
jgi:HPt (histidine-containing phosphotransfer) domain-containing protein